jgi:endonuclease/exonuclease/phosphatase family metal-dependent hydrolase
VSYYHQSFINDDLGAIMERLLEQKTGQNWYRKFINVFGGSWGYGNLLLSRYQPTSSSSTLLSYQRGVVQQSIVVNGRTVNVFSTHVDYYNGSYRTTQTNQAKAWAGTFAAPRIILGDFNTSPGTSDYYIMANSYVDSWAQAKKNGTATSFNGTGATKGTSRFDYVYYTNVSSVVLKSVNVPDTRVNGVWPSDHNPVVAVFEIR